MLLFLRIELKEASIPVISNVTALPVTESASVLNKLLVEQLYSPVRWEESVRKMIDLGVTTFIECGPGKVLKWSCEKNRSFCYYLLCI